MSPQKTILMVLFLCLLVPSLQAIPTTGAASGIGNNNFTISATGCDSAGCWIQYGIYSDKLVVYTKTETPVGGSVTITETGSPIKTDTTYYAAACDATGCGNTVTFKTLPYTTLAITTFGALVTNMTESKFNLLYLASNWMAPYAWLFPANQYALGISIVVGLVFFFIYAGMWYKQRSVAGPVIMGLLTSSAIMYSNQGFNLGIPPEFQAIAQGLLYASLAGIFLTIMKR